MKRYGLELAVATLAMLTLVVNVPEVPMSPAWAITFVAVSYAWLVLLVVWGHRHIISWQYVTTNGSTELNRPLPEPMLGFLLLAGLGAFITALWLGGAI